MSERFKLGDRSKKSSRDGFFDNLEDDNIHGSNEKDKILQNRDDRLSRERAENSETSDSYENNDSNEPNENLENIENREVRESRKLRESNETIENSKTDEFGEASKGIESRDHGNERDIPSKSIKRKSKKSEPYKTIGFQVSLIQLEKLEEYKRQRRMAGDTEYTYRNALEEALDLLFNYKKVN